MALRTALRGLSLCAGVGGLDLGLRLAEPGYRTVCYVERESYAAAALVARMEDEALDSAPVWDCLESFDGRPWRGTVDIIAAGIPCQPWSHANPQRGKTGDERWIWSEVLRVICEVGPRFVFLENVPGFLDGGVGVVLGDLAAAGYDAEWMSLSAGEVGAPHKRDRIWILAVVGRPGLQGAVGGELADADERGPDANTKRPSGELAYADECGQPAERGLHEGERDADGRRGAPTAFPPAYTGEENKWEEVLREYPGLEPAVRRVAHGYTGWVDRVRCIGNGVVPVVAAAAYLVLRERLTEDVFICVKEDFF